MAGRSIADRLVLSPQEPLVAGGSSEAFESQLRQLYRNGQRHLVIDFTRVPAIESAGIRALVRGHTTAQRVEELMSDGAGVRSVAWEHSKRER
jgi:anti-anti-sigma regulatory factor